MFNDVVKVDNIKIVDNSINELTRLFKEFKMKEKSAVELKIEMGEILYNKKKELGYGNYTRWVEEELKIMSVRHAYRCIEVYINRERFYSGEFSSINQFFRVESSDKRVRSIEDGEVRTSVSEVECADFEIVEVTDDDLDQKDKELFNLKTELDKIIEERKQLKKQNKALSNETTEYKKIFNDMESIKVVIRSLLALSGEDDEEKVVESLQDTASVGVYIENCKKIFLKNFTALQYLSIDPNAISCFSSDVKGFLNSVERWVKDMKKRFVITE